MRLLITIDQEEKDQVKELSKNLYNKENVSGYIVKVLRDHLIEINKQGSAKDDSIKKNITTHKTPVDQWSSNNLIKDNYIDPDPPSKESEQTEPAKPKTPIRWAKPRKKAATTPAKDIPANAKRKPTPKELQAIADRIKNQQ